MTEPITKDIRDLVSKVLESGLPRTEHVIDEVLQAIEQSPQWRAEYDGLCERFGKNEESNGKPLVNQMIGRWTSAILGWPARDTKAQVPSRHNGLSETYSVLVPSARRMTTEERRVAAGEAVLAFFRQYREALHRDSLVPLRTELESHVLSGEPVEEAFLSVMATHNLDSKPLQVALGKR
jgi:hypothetical protein